MLRDQRKHTIFRIEVSQCQEERTETESTGSSSSTDSAKNSLLDFSLSGVISKEHVNLQREFLKSWYESVRLEKKFIEKSEKAITRRVDPEFEEIKIKRIEAHNETLNTLNQYAFAVVKNKLEPDTPDQATQETTIQYEKDLKEYIIKTGGDEKLVNVLEHEVTRVSGKQLEFGQNLLLILQKEALDQNARARIAKKKLSKDFQQFQKLSKTRIEKAKNHLLHELIAAQTKANSLEQLVNEQDESHRNFIVEIDSLKRAISQRDEHIALITQGGIEANSELSTELNQTTTAVGVA